MVLLHINWPRWSNKKSMYLLLHQRFVHVVLNNSTRNGHDYKYLRWMYEIFQLWHQIVVIVDGHPRTHPRTYTRTRSRTHFSLFLWIVSLSLDVYNESRRPIFQLSYCLSVILSLLSFFLLISSYIIYIMTSYNIGTHSKLITGFTRSSIDNMISVSECNCGCEPTQ